MIISCRTATAMVTDAQEGKLSMWGRVRYRLHMGICKHCTRYRQQLETTRDELSTLSTEDPVSPDTKASLLEQFRAAKR